MLHSFRNFKILKDFKLNHLFKSYGNFAGSRKFSFSRSFIGKQGLLSRYLPRLFILSFPPKIVLRYINTPKLLVVYIFQWQILASYWTGSPCELRSMEIHMLPMHVNNPNSVIHYCYLVKEHLNPMKKALSADNLDTLVWHLGWVIWTPKCGCQPMKRLTVRGIVIKKGRSTVYCGLTRQSSQAAILFVLHLLLQLRLLLLLLQLFTAG